MAKFYFVFMNLQVVRPDALGWISTKIHCILLRNIMYNLENTIKKKCHTKQMVKERKKKKERSKREIEILGEVSRKPSVIFYMDS